MPLQLNINTELAKVVTYVGELKEQLAEKDAQLAEVKAVDHVYFSNRVTELEEEVKKLEAQLAEVEELKAQLAAQKQQRAKANETIVEHWKCRVATSFNELKGLIDLIDTMHAKQGATTHSTQTKQAYRAMVVLRLSLRQCLQGVPGYEEAVFGKAKDADNAGDGSGRADKRARPTDNGEAAAGDEGPAISSSKCQCLQQVAQDDDVRPHISAQVFERSEASYLNAGLFF